jgi:hypothetical protein
MLAHAGHVRFNEVIMTLMYWNKERNIVPSKAQVLGSSVAALLHALLQLCCMLCCVPSKAQVLGSSVAALLQLCCSSVAALLHALLRALKSLGTSACGLELLVHAALSYLCMRP